MGLVLMHSCVLVLTGSILAILVKVLWLLSDRRSGLVSSQARLSTPARASDATVLLEIRQNPEGHTRCTSTSSVYCRNNNQPLCQNYLMNVRDYNRATSCGGHDARRSLGSDTVSKFVAEALVG